MARKPSRLTVLVRPSARRDGLEIWDYNARTYGPAHADRYLDFLHERTERLSTEWAGGREVPGRPEYRYTLFRKGKGHGHVAIYRVTPEAVEVLRYAHTAQNWQGDDGAN